ncbi:non-homologous end joining protein Ku [Elizabethkingia occulta]|uniref:non-homologous end joining protein Ku n=1 Tax=Elizabethkingia occulta TaxID=1867263 RepID=UPI000999BCD3|nr:Ku protein [Elizabethkingia occulta]OPB92567.1 Ku protein [Elizabethkingia occulta]
MRAIWNGAIGFGLINIPVKLYSASESPTLDLDMLDKNDLSNIKYKRINERTGKEVDWKDIIKGYKLEDQYILLDDEDFEMVSPKKSKILSITQFIAEQEIEPALFETPYFIEPQKNGEAAYSLLLEALLRTGIAGLGTFILREKEIMCLIRPYEESILMVNRLRYPEEMRSYSDLKIPKRKNKAEELKMAEQLIESLSSNFDPELYKNTYNEDLLKIIHQKAKGRKRSKKTISVPHAKASDLMAMLKASIEKGSAAPN